MKKLNLILLLFLAPFIALKAQTRERPVNITLLGGMSGYAGDWGNAFFNFDQKYVDNNRTIGGALSYYFTNSFDVMMMGTYGSITFFDGQTRRFKSFSTVGNINLKYKFGVADEAVIKPYIYLGTGVIFHDNNGGEQSTVSGVEWMPVSSGAGVNFQAGEKVTLQLQLAYGYWGNDNHDLKTGGRFNDAHLFPTVGVGFNLGKIADEDNDGVGDKKDLCAKTPVGVNVTQDGCPVDEDNDGIADYLDKCPKENGSTTASGCPDADKDGIADAEDQCPNEVGLANLKGCPDTDADGVIDSKDKCPDAKGELELSGCPDKDHDGIADAEDQCPDAKGVKLFAGCPDTDDDGVQDKDDLCPNAKGTAVTKGCPDSDNDGVVDNIDKCVTTPGPASNDGCPEVPKEVKMLFEKALQGIQFETGKAIIKPVSFPILDAVAKVMFDNPTYKLMIGGHTDNVGDDQANMTLSQNRAESVQKYLITKGVSPLRITARGYGESVPVDTNKTKAGRARNRRVELKVDFVEVVKPGDIPLK